MNIREVINSDKVDFNRNRIILFSAWIAERIENRFQTVADSTMKEISWKQFFAVICINMCKEDPTGKRSLLRLWGALTRM